MCMTTSYIATTFNTIFLFFYYFIIIFTLNHGHSGATAQLSSNVSNGQHATSMIVLRYIGPPLTNQTIVQGFPHNNELLLDSQPAEDVTELFSAKKTNFEILTLIKGCFR